MLLSHSQIATYQRCPREHHFRYILRRRPRVEAHALRFGKLFDQALQAWWLAGPMFARDAALSKLDELSEGTDPFDVSKARALLLGYDARWANQPLEVLRVQPQFRMPLRSPATGQPSTLFEIQGFLDAIVRDLRTREIVIVEGKTTSSEVNPESSYWRTITTLDPQISTYFDGARSILVGMGIKQEPARALYDVVRKPALKPLKATPEESRRKKKNGELYANQRTEDETPDEYEGRVLEEIFGQPIGPAPMTVDADRGLEASRRYYARGDVVRLEQDEIEHAEDVWMTAQIMKENLSIGRAPRHRGACKRYGGFCDYFAVCNGLVSIETLPLADEPEKKSDLKEV